MIAFGTAGLAAALATCLFQANRLAERHKPEAPAREVAETEPNPGPFVRALWLVQERGTREAAAPAADKSTKARLGAGLDKSGALSASRAKDFFSGPTFELLAGDDAMLDADEIGRALADAAPASRSTLARALSSHMELLSTSFDLLAPAQSQAATQLGVWIAENHRPGEPLHVVMVCTGNSRRSILGATLGNAAAAYVGLPEVHFHSGGTEPSAMNPRTIASLQAIGVSIEATGEEAARGGNGEPNPKYRVGWGDRPGVTDTIEFSKRFDEIFASDERFAAIMVCAEADAECPHVRGASLRLSLPFLDPKLFDGSTFEAAKYAERRDEIARVLLAALTGARRIVNDQRNQ